MKDAVGNELEVGDKVAFSYRKMLNGEYRIAVGVSLISAETPKGIKLEVTDSPFRYNGQNIILIEKKNV